mmetsp:Transcript_11476/g.29037  ORF Transcript_11476/g.29037 Transcript_11476/m.29037 type:complete len:560 (-) Transcript_11476:1284-2963(-)
MNLPSPPFIPTAGHRLCALKHSLEPPPAIHRRSLSLAYQAPTTVAEDVQWLLSTTSTRISNIYATTTRTALFWLLTMRVYTRYKVTQATALLLLPALKAGRPKDVTDATSKTLWNRYHFWAAEEMHAFCRRRRGFYIKAGQFFSTRDDFLHEAYPATLSALQDRAPPMGARKARAAIEAELAALAGGRKVRVEDVFEELDLERPIGSATIAQVHKAKLRGGDGAEVAVKIQFPGVERTMRRDLGNLRAVAAFLSKTEISFDLVSPINELAAEISHEFDFTRERNTMALLRAALADSVRGVVIPFAYPALSTPRLLTMEFLPGAPLLTIRDRIAGRPESVRRAFGTRVLRRLADAYGEMVFGEASGGVFQADPHPGNVLVGEDLQLGIIDFGQAKRLSRGERHAFARLVVAINRMDRSGLQAGLAELGIDVRRTGKNGDAPPPPPRPWWWFLWFLRRFARQEFTPYEKLAYTMFDSARRPGIINDPFHEMSVMKEVSVDAFPAELFLLLKTVQIFRGMAMGIGVPEFSVAREWRGKARRYLRDEDLYYERAAARALPILQ